MYVLYPSAYKTGSSYIFLQAELFANVDMPGQGFKIDFVWYIVACVCASARGRVYIYVCLYASMYIFICMHIYICMYVYPQAFGLEPFLGCLCPTYYRGLM